MYRVLNIHRKRWEKVQLFHIEYTHRGKHIFAITQFLNLVRVEIFNIALMHDL